MSAAALRQRISEQHWAQRVNLAACCRRSELAWPVLFRRLNRLDPSWQH